MLRHRVFMTLLHVCRFLGLFRIGRAYVKGRLMILCYHGYEVDDEAGWWPGVFIKSEVFERRLQTLRKLGYDVVPLGQGVDDLYADKLDRPTAVITIDDGFYSTLTLAAPLLREYNMPTTIYVTTHYAEKEIPVFRLVVQYMFWKTRAATISLADFDGLGNEPLSLASVEDRHLVAWKLIEMGEVLPPQDQVDIMRRLGGLLGLSYADLEENRALSIMTLAEVTAMAQEAWSDIQVHTHRHTFPGDDLEVCGKEIEDNRRVLSQLEGVGELDHFCYPSGIWDKRVWASLEEHGMRTATTCDHGFNHNSTHRFALRRFLDGGYITDIEFEAELSGFSPLVRSAYNRLSGRERP